jgi:hypothetical protein
MKSLAILVVTIFLIDIVAGPIAIALTWPKLVNAISTKSRSVSMMLTVFRRLLHGFLITVGVFIGSWLINIAEPPAKLFGIFSIITSYIALRREYFPEFYLLANISSKLGIRKAAPGDHGPTFKWKKNGRSSGKDGHGPGGQH